MKTKTLLLILPATLLFTSCQEKFKEIQQQASQQFGDQYFKTTISLIEMYKLRHGYYPATLDSLEYMGDWDKAAVASADYTKLDEGYELNIKSIIQPNDSLKLHYTAKFWKGLGIKKSNVMETVTDTTSAKLAK